MASITTAALCGFDVLSHPPLVPKQKQQNDNRYWNADKPKQYTSAHDRLRFACGETISSFLAAEQHESLAHVRPAIEDKSCNTPSNYFC
jgi:hypothetical protein